MTTRLLINGKKAGLEEVRNAVFALRKEGFDIQVRPTWESGDIERLVLEAAQQGVTRLIAGGGDGTVNEVVDAMLKQGFTDCELAVFPLGTANDFATACHIPTQSYYQALKLAVNGKSVLIDVGKANERHFINIATAGFGAQVTATTPVALKNFLGGGAYTLSGLVQAINFQPFKGQVKYDGISKTSHVVVGAICNGRQAGGGQVLAPNALLNDGYLEAVALEEFTPADIPTVIEELTNHEPFVGKFVKRERVKRVEWSSDTVMPINLDGEPISELNVVISVVPSAIRLVVPEECPLIGKFSA